MHQSARPSLLRAKHQIAQLPIGCRCGDTLHVPAAVLGRQVKVMVADLVQCDQARDSSCGEVPPRTAVELMFELHDTMKT